MSDCSTEAMKPKEPPKTCGTCYWMMMQPGHGECGACGNPECGLERWPEAYGNGYYLYTTVNGDCEGEFWKPRTDDLEPGCDACPEGLPEDGCKVKARCYDLEQRCQQLEQVEKDLYSLCDSLMGAVGNAATESDGIARCSAALGAVTGAGHVISHIEDALKELGVSVDD